MRVEKWSSYRGPGKINVSRSSKAYYLGRLSTGNKEKFLEAQRTGYQKCKISSSESLDQTKRALVNKS